MNFIFYNEILFHQFKSTLGLYVNLLSILRKEMVINLEKVSLLRANCRTCLKQEFLTSE